MQDDMSWIFSLVISVCMLVLAAATFFNARKKDTGDDKAEEARVITELKFIGNDVKDIKAGQRATDKRIAEVEREAAHARELAESAHRRLDRAKVDILE